MSTPETETRDLPPREAPGADERTAEGVRRAAFATLIMLAVQFALGSATNLYAEIPAHHPGTGAGGFLTRSLESVGWSIAHGEAELVAHALLGILLVLAAVGLIAQTGRLGVRVLLVAALVGALGVIGAAFNGAAFLDFNKDASSLAMALLSALAMLCYIFILYVLAGRRAGG